VTKNSGVVSAEKSKETKSLVKKSEVSEESGCSSSIKIATLFNKLKNPKEPKSKLEEPAVKPKPEESQPNPEEPKSKPEETKNKTEDQT
jgi:hypothetical protein